MGGGAANIPLLVIPIRTFGYSFHRRGTQTLDLQNTIPTTLTLRNETAFTSNRYWTHYAIVFVYSKIHEEKLHRTAHYKISNCLEQDSPKSSRHCNTNLRNIFVHANWNNHSLCAAWCECNWWRRSCRCWGRHAHIPGTWDSWRRNWWRGCRFGHTCYVIYWRWCWYNRGSSWWCWFPDTNLFVGKSLAMDPNNGSWYIYISLGVGKQKNLHLPQAGLKRVAAPPYGGKST